MVESLEDAAVQSADPADGPAIIVTHRLPQGKRGRPRVEIEGTFLAYASQLRGPSGLAPVLNCSPRTVRRRMLEQGLAVPGTPVYADEVQADGVVERVWTSTTPAVTDISNEELEREIFAILQVFPRFGRRLIAGHLQSKGIKVVRERIRSAYLRVHGAPAIFGDRTITRKVYSVPGVNSLWHHDGQHGRFDLIYTTMKLIGVGRFDSLEDCNPCLHRWEVALSNSCAC